MALAGLRAHSAITTLVDSRRSVDGRSRNNRKGPLEDWRITSVLLGQEY